MVEKALMIPQTMDEAVALADRLSQSGLIPEALRNKPADVLIVMMTGEDYGLSPMQSLRSINVIKGKAIMSAELMVAVCLGKPDCEYFTLKESTSKECKYETKRSGSEPVSLTYTWEEATHAGLTSKDVWRKHPRAMLRARCSAALARAVYPHHILGTYTIDEGEEITGSKPDIQNGAVIVEEPTVPQYFEGPKYEDEEGPTEEPPPRDDGLISEAQRKRLLAFLKARNIEGPHEYLKAYIKAVYELESTKDITKDLYDAIAHFCETGEELEQA